MVCNCLAGWLAGWESGVPRCLEEVSVPGLFLVSF